MFITDTANLVTVRTHKDLIGTAYSNKVAIIREDAITSVSEVSNLVNCMEWNEDGFLGIGGEDGSISVMNATGQLVTYSKGTTRGHQGAVLACDWDVTGRLLVTGGLDECLCLWEPLASAGPISTVPAHSDPILSVSFNKDGYLLASASVDGLIRIWDVRSSLQRCLATIIDDDNPVVSSVQWSPNGQMLLTASMDNAVRLWDVESKRCARVYKGVRFGRIGRARFMRHPTAGYTVLAGGENGLWGWNPQTKTAVVKPNESPVAVIDFDTTGDIVYYISGSDGQLYSYKPIKQT